MKEELKQKLYSILDKERGERSIPGFNLLEVIGEFHGEKKLVEILNNPDLLKAVSESYSIAPPVYVYKFLLELVTKSDPNNIFDPWVSISSPALLLPLKNVAGFCRFPNELDRINVVFAKQNITVSLGDTLKSIDTIKSTFDLILSFPPFGYRIPRMFTESPSLDYGINLIVTCEKILSKNGEMILIVPNSFFNNEKGKDLIKKAKVYINAIFSIPSGAFLPTTNIESNIVVLSREKSDKIFVAQLSQDENTNRVIFENYVNKREGRAIQLGSLVDYEIYKSLKALISEREVQELVKRIGFPPCRLTDIALSIKSIKQENAEKIIPLPNSVYLPKIGNSPAVSNTSAMKIKPRNYYQIQLDETKANAIYVANYFNTEIGKKLRISLEVGSIIPQIPKSQFANCILYLPDISTQSEVLELDGKIEQFNLRLDELRRKLWKQPRITKTIYKELKSINQEDKLESWIDILPFPISSILWRYYTCKENNKRVDHLLHFFEAFNEFLAMIMLSALIRDKEFYKKEYNKWIDKDIKHEEWYLKASFGNWNYITTRISKAVREYLDNKDLREQCRDLFGNPNESFLEIITNKGIERILSEVRELRNKWKGHGGITGDDENKQRLLILEQQLNGLRKCIGDGFEEAKILAPTTSSFESGIFNYSARELTGARTPFKEISFKSLIPLDRNKLYLAHEHQGKPVELIPFIKYIEESNAVYFYMSVESKGVRWVSYHFDKESEINYPPENDLFEAFKFLKK